MLKNKKNNALNEEYERQEENRIKELQVFLKEAQNNCNEIYEQNEKVIDEYLNGKEENNFNNYLKNIENALDNREKLEEELKHLLEKQQNRQKKKFEEFGRAFRELNQFNLYNVDIEEDIEEDFNELAEIVEKEKKEEEIIEKNDDKNKENNNRNNFPIENNEEIPEDIKIEDDTLNTLEFEGIKEDYYELCKEVEKEKNKENNNRNNFPIENNEEIPEDIKEEIIIEKNDDKNKEFECINKPKKKLKTNTIVSNENQSKLNNKRSNLFRNDNNNKPLIKRQEKNKFDFKDVLKRGNLNKICKFNSKRSNKPFKFNKFNKFNSNYRELI